MEITTEECRVVDTNIPQWKRDLILRRRAVGRVLPTGNGSVQLTCPSVVAAVRLAEYSISSDFHRSCESEREQTSGYKNMRLFEQVDTSDDFVEPCVVFGIKEIITKIEGSTKELKMGEEKNGKKKYNSPLICDKKSNELNGVDDDSASDSSEEFKYGPGIVSKLKSKYLSLTLRESQGKVRPSLDSLRRATSLENILNDSEPEKSGEYKTNYLKNIQPVVNGSAIVRCRGLSRSNKESMKRARSVEVLTRYCDRGNIVNGRRSLDTSLKDFENENDEKRNARNRINSLSVEEKELPPPDLVKHTLKIFEKSQNMKNSFSVKKKNQKKVPDSVCAKKPVISPKPFLQKRNNEKIDSRNSPSSITSTEIVNGSSANDITKNYFLDKNSIKNVENSSENVLVSSPASDFSGTILKKKASLCNENSCESVINKISSNDSVAKSVLQNDNIEKDLPSSPMSKNGLELDLTDLAISPINTQRASPKTNSERAISDSLESKRCISPVLVRAPPSIISTELSCTNSPTQHMKQVGVIRPIVTNKVVQSNMTKQQINKPLLTEREIEKNLINKVKCTEQPVTKVIVSLKKSPEECFLSETTKPNESVKKGQLWDKKPNTMVFNFSNRKTVPDYIENDGLILAPRKEKPKVRQILTTSFIFSKNGDFI